MRILLLSKWTSSIVYDLYAFLSSLNGIEVVPCSYGLEINRQVYMEELSSVRRYYVSGKRRTMEINKLCDELDIGVVCISWLLEIRELSGILGRINRTTILFPHGEHRVLKKVQKHENCYLVHRGFGSEKATHRFEMPYFISRRFMNNEKGPVLDGSVFFTGDSNLRMAASEKEFYLGLISEYGKEYNITITRRLLYTYYPFRFYLVRRAVYKMFRLVRRGLDLSTALKKRLRDDEYFDFYFRQVLENPNIDVIEPVPYVSLCDEIAKYNFVEVTPTRYCTFIPARATIGLASGTPLLLKKGYCPPLEDLIGDFGNGYVYDDCRDLINLNCDRGFVNELCENALKSRDRFTLEQYADDFLGFLHKSAY